MLTLPCLPQTGTIVDEAHFCDELGALEVARALRVLDGVHYLEATSERFFVIHLNIGTVTIVMGRISAHLVTILSLPASKTECFGWNSSTTRAEPQHYWFPIWT